MKISQPEGRLDGVISYAPMWETMKKRGATTYTLQVKGGISSSTIRRLKAGGVRIHEYPGGALQNIGM